jgi:hypothetical protein
MECFNQDRGMSLMTEILLKDKKYGDSIFDNIQTKNQIIKELNLKIFTDIEGSLKKEEYPLAKSYFGDYIRLREDNFQFSFSKTDAQIQSLLTKYNLDWKL